MQSIRHAHLPPSFQSSPTSFVSAGVSCAATLMLPADHDGGPLPAILLVHGWGGIQKALTPPFYEEFTRAGFAVMSFDYPGWGESEGQPRNDIKPAQRVRDANAALAHLKTLPQVDARRIVLWGSSLGGGHVVEMAADHPELLGAIAQVPMLDGIAAVRAVPLLRMLRFGLYAIADLLRFGRRRLYIPLISEPGAFGSMDRDEAHKALVMAKAATGMNYDNRITARSLLTMGPYRPGKWLKDIRIPTLIVGGTRDTVAPFTKSKVDRLNNPHLQTHAIDAHHFAPYFEPAFSELIGYELKFLKSLVSR